MKRVLISGGWDLMHYNHLLTLRHAKTLGDWLSVHVLSDERMREKKGDNRPFMPVIDRMAILWEFRCVDDVFSIPGKDYPLFKAIEKCSPDIVVLNQTEQKDLSKEAVYCDERGIKIVYVERINDGVSTTSLMEKFSRPDKNIS